MQQLALAAAPGVEAAPNRGPGEDDALFSEGAAVAPNAGVLLKEKLGACEERRPAARREAVSGGGSRARQLRSAARLDGCVLSAAAPGPRAAPRRQQLLLASDELRGRAWALLPQRVQAAHRGSRRGAEAKGHRRAAARARGSEGGRSAAFESCVVAVAQMQFASGGAIDRGPTLHAAARRRDA